MKNDWETLYLNELFNMLTKVQKDKVFEDVIFYLTPKQIVEAAKLATEKDMEERRLKNV